MRVSEPFKLLKTTFRQWNEHKASRLAAALAYYTLFSLAPLLLIAIAVAGLVFGKQAAQGTIVAELKGTVGGEAAATIEAALQNAAQPGAGSIAAIVGLATLLWGASGLFMELQDSLNTIWGAQPRSAGVVGMIQRRVMPMLMVLGIGGLLLVSLVLSAALAALSSSVGGLLPGTALLWQAVNLIVSLGVVAVMFAAIYKVLPDAEIAWGDVWLGAALAAVLFTLGKLLIGLYLGYASVGSTYGAAGSLVVLLVWIYYSAQILFFGAEFTQVYACRHGSRAGR